MLEQVRDVFTKSKGGRIKKNHLQILGLDL